MSRLARALAAGGARGAVRWRGREIGAAALDEACRRWAAGLAARGVGPGDRVAILGATSLELVVALLGNHYAGTIGVPINPRYREAEVEHIVADAAPRAVVHDGAGAHVIDGCRSAAGLLRVGLGADGGGEVAFAEVAAAPPQPPRPAPEDHPVYLIYTSGTTGKSKGAALSARAMADNMSALARAWGFSPRDRLVLALPLFHVHGLGIGVHGGLLTGVTLDLLPRFEPAAVARAFADRDATVFMGVPTMYSLLLEAIDGDASVASALRRGRLFTSGSAALSARDFARFEEACGHRILERYGMTETLITLSNPLDGERVPGSVGLPVPGTEVRLAEDGEILVRGDGLMNGYWEDPDATAASFDDDGWFRTGDVARRDGRGYFYIEGRKSVDILKSGGFKISAREIEEVLAAHPAVAEVAVYGAPDERWGQRICAAVVLAPDATVDEARLAEELQRHCAAALADYKKPREVRVVDALPRNALGKVQKHRL